MDRIISVINAMITNRQKITNVSKNENVYGFNYDSKYTWSLAENNGSYYLNFFPEVLFVSEILWTENWSEIDYVHFRSDDYLNIEAQESFKELYSILKNKLYNLDKVFDDILNDPDAF